jgi:hypothetical protein
MPPGLRRLARRRRDAGADLRAERLFLGAAFRAGECLRLFATFRFRLRDARKAAFCRFDPKMAICFALILRRAFFLRFR